MAESQHKHIIAGLAVAFLIGAIRGTYLLSWPAGVFLGFAFAFAVFLTLEAFANRKPFAVIRRTLASGFALFVLVVILVPTWISPDFQYTIDLVHDERSMRSELSSLFNSDDRFAKLEPAITHRKITSVDLHGALPNSAALDDARMAIIERCPTVSSVAHVSWNVKIEDTGKRIQTNDGRLDRWGKEEIAE